MPLSLNALNCAARIIGDRRNRHTKQMERGSVGTGFFLTVNSETRPRVRHPYLVTAHHVIAQQQTVEVQIPHPTHSGRLSSPFAVRDWRQPLEGVDLAVAPLSPDAPRYMFIPLETAVMDRAKHTLLFPGSDVYYIGLLDPDDRIMARSGTVGALDQEGLKFQHGYSYTAHLVDCRSYGGFSGSPCFAHVSFAGLTPAKLPVPEPPDVPVAELQHLAMLCGMFTAHRNELGEDGTVSRVGVGVMLRSEEIREALMTDELQKERAAKDDLAAEGARDPGFEAAAVPDDFDHFEALTKRLLKVPKEELDEKRKDES